ncbi:hypothetical protein T484DRAFT_1961689, partial [Baffinella frigidus]
GPMVVLGGGRFLMSEIPLYTHPESYTILLPRYRGTSLIRNRRPPRTTIGP